MKVDLFDFDLPEANIALRPARPRDSARLLLVEGEREKLLHLGDAIKAKVIGQDEAVEAVQGCRPAPLSI